MALRLLCGERVKAFFCENNHCVSIGARPPTTRAGPVAPHGALFRQLSRGDMMFVVMPRRQSQRFIFALFICVVSRSCFSGPLESALILHAERTSLSVPDASRVPDQSLPSIRRIPTTTTADNHVPVR